MSGCSTAKEPKEALQSSAIKAMAMDSYELKTQLKINDFSFDFSESEEATAIFQMLKDAELNITQIYRKDPMQTEVTLEVLLKGDVATTITIPMVITTEKMFIKIPNIPFFPLPQEAVGKYLVLDFKELSEMTGEEVDFGLANTDKSQKLVAEITNVILDKYDSEKYFKNVNAKDITLPEGYKAKQVVQFNVTNDTFGEAIKIFVNEALPQVFDILNKEEYRDTLGVTGDELVELKKQLADTDQTELNEGIEEMKKYLTIHHLTLNTAIDKKDYPSYQNVNMELEFNEPDTAESFKISLEASSTYSKINEEPAFTGIPTDIITIDELQNIFYSF